MRKLLLTSLFLQLTRLAHCPQATAYSVSLYSSQKRFVIKSLPAASVSPSICIVLKNLPRFLDLPPKAKAVPSMSCPVVSGAAATPSGLSSFCWSAPRRTGAAATAPSCWSAARLPGGCCRTAKTSLMPSAGKETQSHKMYIEEPREVRFFPIDSLQTRHRQPRVCGRAACGCLLYVYMLACHSITFWLWFFRGVMSDPHVVPVPLFHCYRFVFSLLTFCFFTVTVSFFHS